MQKALLFIGLLTVAGFGTLLISCGDSEPDIVDTFFQYREARMARDIDSAIAFFADTAKFTFQGLSGHRTVADAERMMGWDFAMNARSDFRDLQVNGDSLVVIAREENDFYRALEIPYREYILTYVFNDNGKIVKQHLVPIAHKGMSTAEAMDGFLKWVRDTHPDRLNEIFRNGAVVFTAQSAEAYKELFAEWRAAGGGPSADKEK